MPTERRYEHLYGRELQDLIAKEPLAWVPLGILEKHGEHLPWGLDALKAYGVCTRLAEQLGGIVLPTSHLAGVHDPWVPDRTEELKMQAEVGNFYLREETFRMLLEDTVNGLSNIGFKYIVLYTGHHPTLQFKVIRQVAEWAEQQGIARVTEFHEPVALDDTDGDHAGKCETSIYKALGGEVRMDQVTPEQRGLLGYYSQSTPPVEEWTEDYGNYMLKCITEYFTKLLNEWRGADHW